MFGRQTTRLKGRVLQSPILAAIGFVLVFGVIAFIGTQINDLSDQIRNQFVPGVQLARDIQTNLDRLQRQLSDAKQLNDRAMVDKALAEDSGFFDDELDAETIYNTIRDQLREAEENESFTVSESRSAASDTPDTEAQETDAEDPEGGLAEDPATSLAVNLADQKTVQEISEEFDDYYTLAKKTTLDWIAYDLDGVESDLATENDQNIQFGQMARAIQVLLQDVQSLADRTNLKLDQKLDDLQTLLQLVTWIGAIITLFFIALLIWNAFRVLSSVMSPINQAVQVADQLSRGNMATTIVVDRDDEIGELLRSMEHMLGYLREMADIAEAIATGNLGKQTDPRSELDLFGRAFRDMSENLRQMIGRVKEAANQVASSATDIAGSSSEITRGAESQSASAEETLSTMVEIAAQIDSVAKSSQALAINVDQTSSSIQEMAASIEQVAKNSTNLLASVDETSSTIEEMAASIQSIEGKVRVVDDVSREAAGIANTRGKELSEMIAAIGGAGKDIGKIIGIIEDIADQTNLLALNAAIEAAHAGDAGRGFAVVAEEVKRLSERSVASTRDIGLVVQNVQESTDEAIILTSEILKQIVDSVNRTSELVAEVYTATQEQSSGAAQILSTSNHMQSVTRQLASAAKEQASGARDMMKAVEVMNRMTQQVADASSEQKQGGDLVVKAVERIAQIAQQNLSAAERLSNNTQNLSEEAERLLNVAEVFTVDAQGNGGPHVLTDGQ